jgi:crotonobetainyl-CoA:carnitine CoA-transferase CaiB-like acyl-CoA transferase
LEPKFYNQFLETLSLEENSMMETQFDSSQWRAQTEFLGNIFEEKPQSYWIDLFSGLDACVAPILTPEEAENEAHIKSREIWVRENGYLMAAAAPRFDDKRPKTLQSEVTIDKKDILSNWN